ncbi:hypothetical protein [Polaribacter sp.]|uniref:hypothetical protein n=1 Tax=Polaribacter sp. TaxID=1920175 RepID=UPI003F6AF225
MSKKSEQNTFEIYENLRAGLMYPSIFYISKDTALDYVDYKEIEELQKIVQPFDKLWISESLEINYHLEADSNLTIFLKKQDILKKNLFELMSYKQLLKPEEFAYLEKSYKEFLYVCMFFSQEMLVILRESTEKELTKYLHLFELQDFHYQKHFSAIEEVLPTSKEEKKTWYRQESNSSEDLKEKTPTNNKDENKNKKVKNKKEKIITDEESQKYLLETVFNVKTD